MPITFSINLKAGYFLSKYRGVITDALLLSSYQDFHEGDNWVPGLHELADLSQADMTRVTETGLRKLSEYVESVYREHGQSYIKTAAFAPTDLPFGIARMYEVFSSKSPEYLQVFRLIDDAESWLVIDA